MLVLAYVLYRQRQVRPVTSRMLVPAILIALGLASQIGYSHTHRLSGPDLAALAGVLVIDAGGLGVVRACTVRLWHEGSQVLRKGTWLTVALWLAGLAIRIAVDQAAHLGSDSLLLYLGVTWLAQRLVLLSRARRHGGPSWPTRDQAD